MWPSTIISKDRLSQTVISLPDPPAFVRINKQKWFIACYISDVWSRIDIIKVSITSTYGTILKINFTKKVFKFAGKDQNTASWVTNVAKNDREGVLQSVVTTSESTLILNKMADGLMKRFRDASKPEPLVIYTDRNCCSMLGSSKLCELFMIGPIVRLG